MGIVRPAIGHYDITEIRAIFAATLQLELRVPERYAYLLAEENMNESA